MKKILLFLVVMLLQFSNLNAATFPSFNNILHPFSKHSNMVRNNIPEPTKDQQRILARITFYHNHGDGYGDKLAMGGRAQQGITIAAHPNFKFGKQIIIPGLKNVIGSSTYIVQDRGSAVTSEKASHKKAYVFDVYIHANSRREGDKMIAKYAAALGDYTYIYFNKTG